VKFLVDESTGQKIANHLRSKGYDVISAIEVLKGQSDHLIIIYAYKEKRIIITNDKDFGELIFRHKYHCEGVIFLRLQDVRYDNKRKVLMDLLKKLDENISGFFVVATERKIRKRPIYRS